MFQKKLSDNEAFSQESIDIQHGIWHFKDGTDQQYFTNIFIEKIKNSFSNVQNLTLACIPASSKVANTCRYRAFSEKVCSFLGMNNGFDHVSIVDEKHAMTFAPKLSNWEIKCFIELPLVTTSSKSITDFPLKNSLSNKEKEESEVVAN